MLSLRTQPWGICLALLVAFSLSCSRTKTKFVRRNNPLLETPQFTEALAPLLTHEFLDLEVPGHGNSVVWLPVGASTRRPIVLAVHGNYETPEAFCAALHEIVGTRAFLLCPRGTERDDWPKEHYTFASPQTLALEVEAATTALYERYPGYVDPEPMMYVGFSRGAFLSVALIATEPAKYPRAILVEGGQDAWTPDRIAMYAAEAGRSRILFACGTETCFGEATHIGVKLKEAQIDNRVVYGPDSGHVYTGRVAEELKKGFEWVVEEDPRWREK